MLTSSTSVKMLQHGSLSPPLGEEWIKWEDVGWDFRCNVGWTRKLGWPCQA